MKIVSSPLFVRVIPDKASDFMLLVGWDRKLVRSTAARTYTLTMCTRESLDKVLAKVQHELHPTEMIDISDKSVLRQLSKQFGEEAPRSIVTPKE